MRRHFVLAMALALVACGNPPEGSSGQSDNDLSADAGSPTNPVDSGTVVDAGDPSTDPTDAGMDPCSTDLVPLETAPKDLHLHCIVQQGWADVIANRRPFNESCFYDGDSPTGGGGVSAYIVKDGHVVQGVAGFGVTHVPGSNTWIWHTYNVGDCTCTQQ